MDPLDHDIHFNRGGWQSIIKTQNKLFNPDALVAISDRLREEFHSGHPNGRQMPEIGQEDWETGLLRGYTDREIGYDLPCLLSGDRPTKGRIMLCAQDPLRRGTLPSLTVGTFFGIDNNGLRHSRRHYGALWNLIRACVHAGYDVLVTDALKIFVGKNKLKKNPPLESLCFDTLKDEIDTFSPNKILAMGAVAGHALSRVLSEDAFIRVPHPMARGKWYLEGSANPEESYSEKLEHYYCRALFGADTPQGAANG